MKIISISGDIGAGKDTVVKILDFLLAGYNYQEIEEMLLSGVNPPTLLSFHRHEKFANTMKKMVAVLLNCTIEKLEDREFKDSPLPQEYWCYVHKKLGDEVPVLPYKKGGPTSVTVGNDVYELRATTPRDILKTIGTACGRNRITRNIWSITTINKLKDSFKLDPNKEIITFISDTRFPEEVKLIKEEAKHKMFIKVTNDTITRTSFTESDTALDDYQFDITIKNDRDFKALIPQVDYALALFLANIHKKEKEEQNVN